MVVVVDEWMDIRTINDQQQRRASEEPGTPKKKFQFNINWKWKWKSMPSMNQWHRYSQHKGFNGPCHSGEKPFNHSSIVGLAK